MKSEIFNIEWPTVSLTAANYLVWWLLLSNFHQAPWICAVLLIFNLALHNSLVHEILHGHPTRIQWLNNLMIYPPLALIFPYPIFKSSHLQHHDNSNLTIPDVDPESYFHCAVKWQTKCITSRWFSWAYMTLAGRVLLNPLISVINLSRLALQQMQSGTNTERLVWLYHVAGCGAVLFIAHNVYHMPVMLYLTCAYLAQSVISIRAFFEHRTAAKPDHRIVVVDSCWFFRVLFLNNNYHATHHRHPKLPWYKIPQLYRSEKAKVLEGNGNFYIKGYSNLLKFLFRPVASPVFPTLPDQDK